MTVKITRVSVEVQPVAPPKQHPVPKWLAGHSTNSKNEVYECWELRLASDLTLFVHNHIDYGKSWLLTCHDLRIDKRKLIGCDTKEHAWAGALRYVEAVLMKNLKLVSNVMINPEAAWP